MAWEGSDRRDRLPSNWSDLVRQVKARAGGRCEWRLPKTGARCPRPGTDCDHKVPGDDHRLQNLQWLCAHHHGQKSSREGLAARRSYSKAKPRKQERHPGERR
jgi:5-methylcytosine-specific restriction enzyme A